MLDVARHAERSALAHLEVTLAVKGCLLPEVGSGVAEAVLRAVEQFEGDALAALDVEGRTRRALQTEAGELYASLVGAVVGEAACAALAAEDERHLAVGVLVGQRHRCPVHLGCDALYAGGTDRCCLSVVDNAYGVRHRGDFGWLRKGDAVDVVHAELRVGYVNQCVRKDNISLVEVCVRAVLPNVDAICVGRIDGEQTHCHTRS